MNSMQIGGINRYQNVNSSVFQAQNSAVSPCQSSDAKQKISFGDRGDGGILGTLKDGLVSLTDDVVGLVGVNAALWWLQNQVNGKLLIGKINEHYTKKIDPADKDKLVDLAFHMRKDEGLHIDKSPDFVHLMSGGSGEAYFSHASNGILPANRVVVGPDKHSALFHELGHAWEENRTTLLKNLQRGRGHYTELALLLYAMTSQNKSKEVYNDDENQGFFSKVKSFIKHSDAIIPLLAFSPELITEAAASIKGLNFLKKQQKAGKITEATLKNIKWSYITCFMTYLFVPVSIMLVDGIRNEAHKVAQKHRQAKLNNYY